jgi:O-antigen ligase/tetratricopeptide (TPR) repeat protein
LAERDIVSPLIKHHFMTINRSLFFTIVGLLFAVLFIPLFVSNSLFFPFITGKNFAFRIIVELAALGWVCLMLIDKTYRPKFSWLAIAVTIFVVIVGIADIFSSNPVKSFLSNFERMEGWITIAHLALYFFILTSVFHTWTFWKRFFQVSVGVSAIVCIHGFMQLAGSATIHQSVSRLDASFGNATYLAIYMLFHVFITAILLVRHLKDRENNTKSIWHSNAWYTDLVVYIYMVMMILQAIILFFTATRGSILGIIGGFIISAILVMITEVAGTSKENKILLKISIGILVTIVVLIGLFFLTKDTSFVKDNEVLGRIASISVTDNTTKARFMIWNMAWKGVTQDPKHFVIGWGQESFNYLFATYYNPGMYGQEQWFDRSHNVVFDWLTASGILGLLSYLSIFALALYTIWWKSNLSKLEKSLITGLLAGYFFHNLFVFDNIVSYIMFFTILAYVNSSIESTTSAPIQTKNNHKQDYDFTYEYGGMVLLGIIFVGIFYQYNYKPISANLALIRAITPTQIISASSTSSTVYTIDNVEAFKETISYNTVGLYETREQLMDIAQKSLNTKSDDSVKQDLVTLAESEIKRQLAETPDDVRYYVLGGNFYQNIGDLKNAADLLVKAEQLSPKKQSLLFVLGSNYFAHGQKADALATFKKAYDLDMTFDEAKKLYGLVAFYMGQDKITNDLLGPGPIMDSRFLAAYKATKRYDLMIAYLEKSATQNTGDVKSQIEAKISLAAGYLTVGNRVKAITTLQNIKTLTQDASAQTQIDSLIKDIQAGKNPFETATQ